MAKSNTTHTYEEEELDETQRLIRKLQAAINKCVERVFDDENIDQAYYPMIIHVVECNNEFEPIHQHTILDEVTHSCSYCGTPTRVLLDTPDCSVIYVCAACHAHFLTKDNKL
jgi:DNA-directed RNA polymerase subunit RPC12/RpoP